MHCKLRSDRIVRAELFCFAQMPPGSVAFSIKGTYNITLKHRETLPQGCVSPVHICIVAPAQLPVPPLMGGSVEICIHAIARQLAKEHKVTVIGRRHRRLPNRQSEGNLTYVRVPADNYASHVVNVLRKGSYDWIQVDNRPALAAHIKNTFPRTPVSLFLHSLTFISPPRLRNRQASALLAKPDMIVANSESLFEVIAKRHPRVKNKIRKVLLGVDTDRFRPPTPDEKRKLKTKYGIASGAFTVLFAGRIIPRKGIPVLLKAMQELRKTVPRAKIVIAGGGRPAYLAKLKQQAKRLGVPAVFTGLIAHRSIHLIYRLADAFVCPSQKHEAFGLVNIEAMASGVPVVASRIGGIGEAVVHGRNGYLVDAYRDPKQFARHLAQLAKQTELARKLSEQAQRDAIEKFSWSATARKLAQQYRHGEGGRRRDTNAIRADRQFVVRTDAAAHEQQEGQHE